MNQIISNISTAFVAGAQQLHHVLMPVTMVAMFAGLIVICHQAMLERSVQRVFPFLVRSGIAVVLLGGLATWADTINNAVADVLQQTMFSGGPLSVATSYQQALAQKFGTNSATTGQTTFQNQPVGTMGAPQTSTGTKVTAYGFQGDLTPDGNSKNGIGNHGNQLTGFGGLAPASAALTASAAQQYGVALGQNFSVQGANGQVYNLTYADTAPESDSRIDIFDPSGLLSANDNQFETAATSVTNGGMSTLTGIGNGMITMPTFSWNPTTWGSTIVEIVAYLLSILALSMMVIMTIFQNIAYLLMIAVSPIMISFMLIPALTPISTRFFTSLFSITLWPIGWVLADLVSKLILTAITSTDANAVTSMLGFGFSFGMWIFLAFWIILSSVIAPILVSRALVTGGTGLVQVLASAAGISSMVAMRSSNVVIGAIGSSTASGGSGLPQPSGTIRPNFANRGTDHTTPKV